MAHYIGNARTLEIYAPNRRDDLVPDPDTNKVTFDLSQEVPGGYESNVVVVRRKFLYNELCKDNTTISFNAGTNTLTTTDDLLSAILSSLVPGQSIKVAGSAGNNGLHKIVTVTYTPGGTGTLCTIMFDALSPILATEAAGPTITLTQAYDGPWEQLEPEVDYTIGGAVGPQYNRLITLSEILQEEDVCYVIHRGDSTYNFTPSQASVGPDQLQENLRNFKFDRFTGDGVEDTFTLSQFAVNGKSIVVYVNGVVQEPNDAFFLTGDYTLDPDGVTLTFTTPPPNLAKIRVLHLGFTTVSRRAVLSDGQIGVIGADTIGTLQLQNGSVTEPKLATGAVSNSKIQNNAVNGAKILLNNFSVDGDSLRGKRADTVPTHLIYINGGNETVLLSDADMPFVRTGSGVKMRLDASQLRPELDNGIGLGAPAQRYSHIYVNGTSRLGPTEVDTLQVNGTSTHSAGLSVTGNISVTGNVDGVEVSNLYTQVQDIQINLIPAGTIVATGRSAAPTGYLMCDGGVYAQVTYPLLFSAIGSTYNVGGEGVGNFRVPDGRQRFPLGKAVSGTGSVLGSYGGVIDHTHTIPSHTHDISHTHTLPGHYHAHSTGVGSNINIVTSGSHQTDLAHSHSNSITPGGEGLHDHNLNAGHAIVINSGGSHSHGHTLSVSGAGGHEHTAAGSTSAVGDHSHVIQGAGISSFGGPSSDSYSEFVNSGVVGNSGNRFTKSANSGFSNGAGATNGSALDGGSHGHTFSVGTSGGGGHSHSIAGSINSDGSHSHTIGGTIYNYGSAHQHTIVVNPVPSGTFSSSNGLHTHDTNTFAGNIGNVNSGINGNSDMTTTGISTTTSGSGGAGNTGANNPPFFVVNYMIKT